MRLPRTLSRRARFWWPAPACAWSWAVVESVDSGFVYFRQISAQDAARRGSLVKPLPQSA